MKRLATAFFLVFLSLPALSAQQVTAEAAVSAEEVFVGEPFFLQITVDGADAVEEPRLEGFEAFRTESLGGQANNSQSITIVNGQMSRVVRNGYVLSFRLTPLRAGTFTLPSVRLKAGGKAVSTAALTVRVAAPAETEDYKLRIAVSRPRCYVGEPLAVTVTWYLAKDARSLESLTVPLFLEPDLTVSEGNAGAAAAGDTALPLNGGRAMAVKGSERLDGRDYTTFSFRRVIVARKAGTYSPAEASVSFEGAAGVRSVRDPFWGASQQASYRKYVIPSNKVTLTVLEVPQEGRPADYHGHVGRIVLSAHATPTEANVGDPITFTVEVSGPEVLDAVEFPHLRTFPGFTDRFKIPEETSAGEVQGGKKSFPQTLRARSEGVTEIPPVTLSYFDTETATFRRASTEAIPLVIHAGREVTLRDVEGSEGKADQAEVQSRSGGIAHNYEDAGVLRTREAGFAQLLSSPWYAVLIIVPVAVYLAALVYVRIRRAAAADPARARARGAPARFRKALASLRAPRTPLAEKPTALLDCLREYLADRLSLAAGSLTFEDVRVALDGRLDAEVLEALRGLFTECEAGRYAGSVPTEEAAGALLDRAERVVADLEGSLP